MKEKNDLKCEDCKDGYVTLLLTSVKCEKCDGKGFVPVEDTSCEDEGYVYGHDLSQDQLEMQWCDYIINRDADTDDSID